MRHPEQDSFAPRGVVKLTRAEAQVVSHAARGLTNKEIGRALGKAETTVRNQLHSVYRKLGVNSRLRLILMFRE